MIHEELQQLAKDAQKVSYDEYTEAVSKMIDELEARYTAPARDTEAVSLVKSRSTILRYLEDVDPEAFEAEWDLVRDGQAISPLFDEELVRSTVDFYVASGEVTQEQIDGIDLDQFFDRQYVEAAFEALDVTDADFTPSDTQRGGS
jgi:hypothetical protein